MSGNSVENPIIPLKVSNIFNKRYFLANSRSGSNITPDSTGNPVVYAGAPRFASMTFQVDYRAGIASLAARGAGARPGAAPA